MPLYLLSVCYPADAQQPEPERLQRIMADVGAWRDAVVARGSWVFGGGLHDPSTATTVVDRDGEVLLTDGPFIEAKEQIGGITVIEAADLDEAVEMASAQSRATTTPIEVRPFMHGGTG
ncbi:MAG: YciI family protein [Actinomycetota bacterium]|nr:YciI family protein [Actinomycetota bacterium]